MIDPGLDKELVAVLSGGAGMGLGAVVKAWSSGRRVDKVDAVEAISAAYSKVIQRMEAQLDSLEGQVADLRKVIDRKDALYERMLDRMIDTVPPVAPPVVHVHPTTPPV